jgi:hypothetical protein
LLVLQNLQRSPGVKQQREASHHLLHVEMHSKPANEVPSPYKYNTQLLAAQQLQGLSLRQVHFLCRPWQAPTMAAQPQSQLQGL